MSRKTWRTAVAVSSQHRSVYHRDYEMVHGADGGRERTGTNMISSSFCSLLNYCLSAVPPFGDMLRFQIEKKHHVRWRNRCHRNHDTREYKVTPTAPPRWAQGSKAINPCKYTQTTIPESLEARAAGVELLLERLGAVNLRPGQAHLRGLLQVEVELVQVFVAGGARQGVAADRLSLPRCATRARARVRVRACTTANQVKKKTISYSAGRKQ